MKPFFFIFFLFSSLILFGQLPSPSTRNTSDFQPLGNPYLDSEYLLTQITSNEIKEIVRIINFYAGVAPDNTDTTIIARTIRENFYLKELLQSKLDDIKNYLTNPRNDFKVHAASAGKTGVPATGVSALTLFPATKVADGLGTFIAERFKEELTQRYLQAFRDTIILNDDKYHYSTLLPRTYSALVLYENVFDYKSFMTVLKEAFKDDLDNLAPNSLVFLEKLKADGSIKTPDEQFYLIHYLADYIVNKIPDGQPLTSILYNIEQYPHKGELNKDVYGYIRVAGIIASNLVNNNGEIDPEDITKLFFNRSRLLAFAGLAIEKERKSLEAISIKSQDAYDVLNVSNTDIILHFIQSINQLRTATALFEKSEKKIGDIIQLSIKTSPAIKNLISHFGVMPEADLAKAFLTLSHIINIYDFSSEQKYGLIITESLSLFTDLGISGTSFFMTFKKYGLFISNVAQAENAQEVKEALDVAALPVGSYKIKRNSFFDISLNAYPGLTGGVEFRSGIPEGANVESANPTLGFTAPIGLSFSWGQIKQKTKPLNDSTINRNEFNEFRDNKWISKYITGRSHSLFVSVLDIGAITSFRLVNDDTEALPEFNWNNILAPGLYYVNGWKDTPLTMGIGVQYGPQLRTIEIDGASLELDKALFSVRLFLTVDVPLFNFYTRTTP
jgi:hypothetical protein